MKLSTFLLAAALNLIPLTQAAEFIECTTKKSPPIKLCPSPDCSLIKAKLWICIFEQIPHGVISVKLDSITSVNIHNYLLNGKTSISELTIDTTGNNTIRIYCVLGNKGIINSKRIATAISERYEQHVGGTQVVKEYPHGTHSHSIEYYLENSAIIEDLYQCLMQAWIGNTGRRVVIRNK